jgi:predicted PurR-regulated permease PerM
MITPGSFDRSRLLWWGITAVLTSVFVLLLYSYVGTFVLGVFIYYAARPLYRKLQAATERPGLAAAGALFAFEIPILAVTGYLLFLALREFDRYTGTGAELVARVLPVPPAEIERAIADPGAYLGSFDVSGIVEVLTTGETVIAPVATFFVHFSLAIAVAFYLLRDGDRLAGWFRSHVGEESAFRLYASLVDRDLQVVYSGNVHTVIVVAVLAVGIYNGLNLVAPPGLKIPIPNVLALMTGVATLVPILVGKVVYVPLTVYLGNIALESSPGAIWFPVVVALVALLALDLAPIMLIRPYLAGESTHRGLMMFSYLFGGLLFGWYGIFLGPLLLVPAIHLVRVGFTELLKGERITPEVESAPGMGAMPRFDRQSSDGGAAADGGTTTDSGDGQ